MAMTEDPHQRVRELEARLDAMSKRLDTAEDEMAYLEDELQARDDRIDELESRLDAYETRTDLLDSIEADAALKPKQRAAVLIQTLHNEAVNTNGHASIDASGAVKALGGSVNRTLMYGENGAFQKAVDAVDDTDVLRLVTENRAAKRNTRLELDLTAGTLPEVVAGVDIKGGVGD